MLNSLKLMNTCINAIDSGICIIDQQGIIQMVNETLAYWCESKAEALESKAYNKILPEDRESAIWIEALIKGEQDELAACKIWWKTPQKYRYIKGYAIDEISSENGKSRILFLSDISEEVKQKNQLQYQALVLGNVQDSIIVTDPEGIITYWHKAATELFGYTEEEMLGFHMHKLNPNFDPKSFLAAAQGRKDYHMRTDWKYIRPDGREVWADVKVSLLYDESETEFKGFVGVSKDITEKKQQEQDLIRRTKELDSVIESQTNFLIRADIEGYYTFANRYFLEKFGYDESIIGKHFSSEIHPGDLEKSKEGIKACLAYPGKGVPIELRKPKGDGTYYTNYWEFVGITNEEGEVTELQGVGYDITERKEAESKVQYLKAFNELLLEISTDLVNSNYRNRDERIVRALEEITKFTGFDRAVMYLFDEDKSESYLQYEYYREGLSPTPPQTHKYAAASFSWWIEKIFKLEAVEISNAQTLSADAETTRREMEAYGVKSMITVPVAYEQDVLGFVGFTSMEKDKSWDQDIVALLKLLGAIFANTLYRTRTVQELEESRNQYKLLADNISDVVIKHDPSLRITFVTPSCKEMLGYIPDELLDRSFTELVHPEDLSILEEHVQQILAGRHIRFVNRLKKKSNEYFWVETSAKAFEDEGKTELIAVIRDIDIQKRIEIEKDELFRETHALNEELRASEEELRQTLDKTVELNDQLIRSEQKFKGLTEKSFDGIVVYGPDASIKYVSPSATHILGYDQEDIQRMTGRDLIHPDDLPWADEKMYQIMQEQGGRVSFEVRSIRKDGEVIWVECSFTNLLEDPAIEGIVGNFREVTERRKTAIYLEEIRTSLNMAQRVAKVGNWELELATMKSYLSDEFYNILGLGEEKHLVSLSGFMEYVHPEDRERLQTLSGQVMQGQKVSNLAYRIIDRKGELKYVRAHSRPLIDEQGKIVKILGTIQDVTKEMELERLLDETSIMAKVGGWEVNLLNNELIWTKETYAIHELPFGQALNTEEAIFFYHPDDRPILEEALNKMMTEGEKYNLELRIITATGKLKWIRTTGGIVNKSNGKVIKIRGSIQDITERKLREEEVKKYSERLTLATESAQIGIWDLDIQHNMLYWDRQTCRIFGVNEDHYQGNLEGLRRLIYSVDQKKVPELEELKTWKSDDMNILFRIIRPDTKEIRFIKSSAKVLFDHDQRAIRMIGVHWDITSLRENEEHLKKNNEELRKTNAELDHFVYSTSHNLRAPLTSVMGIVDILRESNSDEERKEFIDLIQKSIYKLDETIQEINDYSKNSRVEIEKVPIDLTQMIEGIAESLSFMDNARKMKLEVSIADHLMLYSDPGRLKIIFNNLLSNAVKYANPMQEKPFVSISVIEKANDILIQVKDNGIGIKQEYLNKIFNMFFRATNKSSGSGLGLYIVKEATEKLGGDISVKSAPGEGTEFMLRLPNLK
ncbi:PAS domain S-box protein [Catalinimonas niigatensis]|uniref:PAS domain S-box protein n=1 Tax=Catalinimonas niigatensis TaxID=1397264 RepID=UPI00266599D4|nr:PAS domain S-box protein [Catalinimonas niigatensis]WPP53254.1 PAS domain S-box protein [Catalinimonas niigatensis]